MPLTELGTRDDIRPLASKVSVFGGNHFSSGLAIQVSSEGFGRYLKRKQQLKGASKIELGSKVSD
ncbi:MAG: hypothetical protein QNJ46_18770 [Leptolyngbyaceae cyanobacterium MO_188.B28]|nr:hypothetical protein [Leptolyngbyaceae cyanobacterium MO_188.B28]